MDSLLAIQNSVNLRQPKAKAIRFQFFQKVIFCPITIHVC